MITEAGLSRTGLSSYRGRQSLKTQIYPITNARPTSMHQDSIRSRDCVKKVDWANFLVEKPLPEILLI